MTKKETVLVDAHQSEVQDIQHRLNDKNFELHLSHETYKEQMLKHQMSNDAMEEKVKIIRKYNSL